MLLFLASKVLLSLLLIAPPPPTDSYPVGEETFGEELVDEYRWLESLEGEDEAVRNWTTAQNAYTRSILDHLPGRDAIEARIAELMTIGSVSAPTMRGNRYFYRERQGTENQSVLYMREGHDGEPQILIDPNTLDEEGLYSLDWYEPDHSGKLLAFGLSYAGDEMTVLYVLDVDTGRWLADEISGKVRLTGWLADGSGFMYGKLVDPKDAYSRSFRFHEIGTHPTEDVEVIRQDDPSRIPSATITKDGRWIVITYFEGWARQDVLIADADEWRRTGAMQPEPVAFGLDATFSVQIVQGDTMYLLTSLDAPNRRLLSVDLHAPARENWTTVIPERPDAVLGGVSEARGIMIASYEKDATTRFERFSFSGRPMGSISLPGLGSASVSTEQDRTEAFLTYTSYNEPTTIYRLDVSSDDPGELWARPEVPVEPAQVVVKQEFYQSKDGTRVPMFIVHRKDLVLDGSNPCVLYGYGGFNASMTPYFSATRFAWYEQGGVYVVANLRGGSEYGESWHRAGMLQNKQNVFDDFYAAAEHLIARGYTSPEHLACQGGSNGGLLTGVALTQRPDLWACFVCQVPLLDMLRYDQFLMAKFWVPEYGSPSDPAAFKWLRAYSPYQNVIADRRYPAVLFTAGENDNRVHPLHARKMTARLQARASNDFDEDPIMLWVDRAAGHGSGKPLSARIQEVTDQHMFIAWQTGMLDRYLRKSRERP